jgi:GrpB-like predicted nucleotidyltransferase (UPF0157 family)
MTLREDRQDREDDAIRVIDYDVNWPLRFRTLEACLCSLLGAQVVRVEHIGSTSVPGLAAKPVLDVDVVVRVATDLQPSIAQLEKGGYLHEGDLGVPGREVLRRPPGSERHHLYVLVDGSRELRRHLAFRDALRADQALREEYAALKRALAQRFRDDRRAYTSGKSDFIEATLKGPRTTG